jgi:hypothetical protein
VPPPPGATQPASAELRLSPPTPWTRENTGSHVISFQDLLQPSKLDNRSKKRKKKAVRKLLSWLLLLGLIGGVGYAVRNTTPVQRVLGHEKAAPLPETPFTRPTLTSAEYSVTLSAVQNGVPNNVTTKVRADFARDIIETTVESQVGGAFTTTQEIRNTEFVFKSNADPATGWTRVPRTPDLVSPYDVATFIPMVNDIIDQPLRDGAEPKVSKTARLDGVDVSVLTYVIDRARVPEIAPAIFARVPWLFDVPNASTLTVEVSYDKSGLVRHLAFRVDPPQPGTGSDATWVTSYSMDIVQLNVPEAIETPVSAIDVPVAAP